jgi:hypothetical protein
MAGEEEAIRVLKQPKWTPGKINDEPVRVKYMVTNHLAGGRIKWNKTTNPLHTNGFV